MYVIMFDESYFQLYKAFLIVMLILVVIALAVALFVEHRKAKKRREIYEFYANLAPLKVPKAVIPDSTPSPLTAPKVDVPKSTFSSLKAPKASQDK